VTPRPSQLVLLVSDRPTTTRSLSEQLERLTPPPEIWSWRSAPGDWQGPGAIIAAAPPTDPETIALAIVDLESGLQAMDRLRPFDISTVARRVALAEGARTERLIQALASGYDDYLFFPINPAELGLVWHRHLGSGEIARLQVEVDEQCLCVRCPSDVVYLEPAVTKMVATCRRIADLESRAEFRLRIALGEAVANAMLHGNREDHRRQVTIRAETRPQALWVWVADEGKGFDPATVPDPRDPDRVERSSGRGLYLLRTLMDNVTFSDNGTVVRLELDR
jgi:anti-sigma regulatory factor (Ser/Thr protein kinase)